MCIGLFAFFAQRCQSLLRVELSLRAPNAPIYGFVVSKSCAAKQMVAGPLD